MPQIIGPGEKVKVHDEDAERAAEIAKETAAGADIGSLIMSPPTMIKEWKFLVIRIYKAEGLPIMDGAVGVGFAAVKKAGMPRLWSSLFLSDALQVPMPSSS